MLVKVIEIIIDQSCAPLAFTLHKFFLYHLPTRGRVGIKLGDVDTSPTYLYFFIVPYCYIIILGCFTIILLSFYIIFDTNLLT